MKSHSWTLMSSYKCKYLNPWMNVVVYITRYLIFGKNSWRKEENWTVFNQTSNDYSLHTIRRLGALQRSVKFIISKNSTQQKRMIGYYRIKFKVC
jgi:hypothetical protein